MTQKSNFWAAGSGSGSIWHCMRDWTWRRRNVFSHNVQKQLCKLYYAVWKQKHGKKFCGQLCGNVDFSLRAASFSQSPQSCPQRHFGHFQRKSRVTEHSGAKITSTKKRDYGQPGMEKFEKKSAKRLRTRRKMRRRDARPEHGGCVCWEKWRSAV